MFYNHNYRVYLASCTQNYQYYSAVTNLLKIDLWHPTDYCGNSNSYWQQASPESSAKTPCLFL